MVAETLPIITAERLVNAPVSVSCCPPVARPADGDTESRRSGGEIELTLNGSAFDAPPGAGFVTITLVVPTAAMSLAGMSACTCVLLTKEVVRLSPFHCTVAPLIKFAPLTVSTNAPPPAPALSGLNPLIVGTFPTYTTCTDERFPAAS